ncbi:MAG: phosphodiester glycosidase family protein [Rhodothermales bacterium]|nr:phosphodiester glycosidase family protein [Rhodothermales bacterium]MBO6780107.1 phosphodiester glycosidase family protein [Rhodothermales bacterium]
MKHFLARPLVLLLSLVACGTPPESAPVPPDGLVAWLPVDSLNEALPVGVRVYEGRNDSLPLAAWYVHVDLNVEGNGARVEISDDGDRRETVSEFASSEGACVALNGGYFRMGEDPATHVGLLMADGEILTPAIGSVLRSEVRYPVARATLGITETGRAYIAWVNSRADTTLAWSSPPPNEPGRPAEFPDLSQSSSWPMRDALSAGPRLLEDGTFNITVDEEVFFGSSIPRVHPRSAVGVTADGSLILMVVDGRQRASRGVDLDELAELLASTGAVDGMNLDGGGSSALVVNGHLLNRPAGERIEREVMSAVLVDCAE